MTKQLKCWKKVDNNIYNHYDKKKEVDKTLILQEGTNIMIIEDWKGNKGSQTSPAPNRKKLETFSKVYIKRNGGMCKK